GSPPPQLRRNRLRLCFAVEQDDAQLALREIERDLRLGDARTATPASHTDNRAGPSGLGLEVIEALPHRYDVAVGEEFGIHLPAQARLVEQDARSFRCQRMK